MADSKEQAPSTDKWTQREEEGSHRSQNSKSLLPMHQSDEFSFPGVRRNKRVLRSIMLFVFLKVESPPYRSIGNKWSIYTLSRSPAQCLQNKISGDLYEVCNFPISQHGWDVAFQGKGKKTNVLLLVVVVFSLRGSQWYPGYLA